MNNLKLAIQKSGRLTDLSLDLLRKCDIDISNSSKSLKTVSGNFPLEILFLRDDDIPQYIEDGVVDIGIVGENVLDEHENKIDKLHKLGFAKCRLSIAIPKSNNYEGVNWLQNKKIATSYPNILKNYLQKNKVQAEIHVISGSVEIAPSIGLADAICDIVSTGSTLLGNGLKEAEQIYFSQAVIAGANNFDEHKKNILDKLLFRINAVQSASHKKYILLNAPNQNLQEIINMLPGANSPTVMPLAKEGWSSVHSVANETDFWQTIDRLKEKGAESILVIPIEKMID